MLRAQRISHIPISLPQYLLHAYMDPLGLFSEVQDSLWLGLPIQLEGSWDLLPKPQKYVYKIMAFRATIMGLGPLFYTFWGFR